MRVCETCESEVKGLAVSDDDWIDYCEGCETIVEGSTKEVTESEE